MRHGEKRFNEPRIYFGDSTFFSVFSIPLLRGEMKTALAQPNTVVLSALAARKYFGSDDPLGKTLSINNDGFDLQVSGVMQDIPANTHFHCDFLISLSTTRMSRNPSFITNNNFHTYTVLRPKCFAASVGSEIPRGDQKICGGASSRALRTNGVNPTRRFQTWPPRSGCSAI